MSGKNKKIIVVLGPTSSGKSDLAVDIAKKNNGEIVSADSRQVYKDMDLGTGKVEGEWKKIAELKNSHSIPFKKEEKKNDKVFIYRGVRHHLIDFVSPKKEYNISHFKKDCEQLIEEIDGRDRMPIICGGTGFWINAVVYNRILPKVKPDKELRNKLRNKTAEALFKELKKLDPKRAESIDKKNKVRLIRAIEIVKELGQVPEMEKGTYKIINSGLNNRFYTNLSLREEKEGNKIIQLSKENEILDFLLIGKKYSMGELSERIRTRLNLRFEAGMIKEIEKLKEKYNLSWKKVQSFGLAYYWIPLYLQKKIPLKELKERVYLAERQYAKRQMTWFKKQKGINWV